MARLYVIDNIIYQPDPEELAGELKLDALAGAVELEEMLAEARRIVRPRACYALLEVEDRGNGGVVIGGEEFDSRVLKVNLKGRERTALFVATCGRELEKWSMGFSDLLIGWVADEICESALRCAVQALEAEVDLRIGGSYRGSMNPGSLEDWPLTQQGPLFRALGGTDVILRAIGVELTASCLMLPRKSLSGVRFASDEQFADCLLCPREDCRGRRLAFDRRQFDQRFSGAHHGTLYAESCACGRDRAR